MTRAEMVNSSVSRVSDFKASTVRIFGDRFKQARVEETAIS